MSMVIQLEADGLEARLWTVSHRIPAAVFVKDGGQIDLELVQGVGYPRPHF